MPERSMLLAGNRRPLKRLPRDEYEDQPRYLHPGGYVIEKERRSWSERVGAMRGQASGSPLTWWSVFEHAGSLDQGRFHPWARKSYAARTFDTLREARAWCDENPRWGAR